MINWHLKGLPAADASLFSYVNSAKQYCLH